VEVGVVEMVNEDGGRAEGDVGEGHAVDLPES
jgi:hypothetical protein